MERVLDFNDLRESWERSESAGVVENIFQTRDWNEQWWNCFSANKELQLWRAEAGGVDCILPFYRARESSRRLPLPEWQEIRFVGTGESVGTDYPDVLAPRNPESARLLCRWDDAMEREGFEWDTLSLRDVRPDSRVMEMCRRLRDERGHLIEVRPRQVCPVLRIDGKFEEYLSGRLSKSFRSTLRNKGNRLRKDFRVELRRNGDGISTKKLLDDLIRLHQMRWGGADHGGKFSDPRYMEFHRRIIGSSETNGRLMLSILYLDGEPAAANYGYEYEGWFYFYQSGLRPGLGRYSPGLYLMSQIIEGLHRREMNGLDFLRGDEPYKFHFTDDVLHTYNVHVYNRSRPLGRILQTKDRGVWFLRSLLGRG